MDEEHIHEQTHANSLKASSERVLLQFTVGLQLLVHMHLIIISSKKKKLAIALHVTHDPLPCTWVLLRSAAAVRSDLLPKGKKHSFAIVNCQHNIYNINGVSLNKLQKSPSNH